jgi:hypothetical protein
LCPSVLHIGQEHRKIVIQIVEDCNDN